MSAPQKQTLITPKPYFGQLNRSIKQLIIKQQNDEETNKQANKYIDDADNNDNNNNDDDNDGDNNNSFLQVPFSIIKPFVSIFARIMRTSELTTFIGITFISFSSNLSSRSFEDFFKVLLKLSVLSEENQQKMIKMKRKKLMHEEMTQPCLLSRQEKVSQKQAICDVLCDLVPNA